MKSKQEKFELLRKLNKKHHRGSWAIWSGATAKEAGDCSILDKLPNDKKLFNQLNFNYVIVALNASGKRESPDKVYEDWRNFHSKSNKDYRLPLVFKDTEIWGAYMTDFIKFGGLGSDAGNALDAYSEMPDVERKENLAFFEKEIDVLGLENIKKIIVLGKETLLLMKLVLPQKYRDKMVGICHYAVRKGDAAFLEKVNATLPLKKK